MGVAQGRRFYKDNLCQGWQCDLTFGRVANQLDQRWLLASQSGFMSGRQITIPSMKMVGEVDDIKPCEDQMARLLVLCLILILVNSIWRLFLVE